MNPTELEIYNKILERISHTNMINNAWLKKIWWDKESFEFAAIQRSWLYQDEYKPLDYLDGRKNLIEIPNFCKHTGEKVDKKKIKKELLKIK